MADRSIGITDTLETLRTTYNSTAADVGDIADLQSATGTIASSTDIVEAVTAMNTEIAALKAGTSVFETKIVFEGATDDDNETTLGAVDPTADRTINLPNESGTLISTGTTANTFITGQTSISSGDIVSGNDELLVSDADASALKRVTVDNLISSAGGLTSVAADSSPQLGADLDVNGNDIVSVSNGNISLLPNGSGKVIIDGNGSSGGVSITDGLIDIRTGTGDVTKVKFYCESSNAHAQTLQAQPHSASSSATLVLPVASGTLIGTGDTGTLPLAAIDIDGGSDIGADLTTSDLIIVDDGAGGTNRKAALSRLTTFMTGQGFVTDDPTALAIALG